MSVQVEGLEEFAIVRVTPRWLRYYDARPESFHVTEGNWPPPGEQGSPAGASPAGASPAGAKAR